MPKDKPIDRPTARLVIPNEKNEVLFFRLEGDGGPFWATPGGGLEAGESYEQAARRELKEETGIEVETLGPMVWNCSNLWNWRDRIYRSLHRFYLIRLRDTPDVNIDRLTGFEAEATTGYRWWSIDEISRSSDRFAPPGMVDHLTSLFAGEIPHRPVDAGPFTDVLDHKRCRVYAAARTRTLRTMSERWQGGPVRI